MKFPSLSGSIRFIRQLPRRMHEMHYKFTEDEAHRLLEKIKGHIEEQDLPWVELSSGYARFKSSRGLEPGIWIATKELYNSLQVVENEEGFYIGAPIGTIHQGSGLEINDLITILEYGTIHIPERPLFTVSKREMRSGRVGRFISFATEFFKELGHDLEN